MKYRIVDENGEVQGEFGMKEGLLSKLIERLAGISNLADIARYTPIEITLLDQLQLLTQQSVSCPQFSAANTDAMCKISAALAALTALKEKN